MPETLLSICQAASEELLFDTPNTIVGNQDADAVLMKRYASQTCKELVRDYRWQALKRTYTFITEDGTEAYELPSDLKAPISLTFWNRTEQTALVYAGSIEWQALKSGVNISGVRYRFRFEQNRIKLFPVPTSAITIVFDYYSNAFAETAAGAAKADFTLDTDVCRLDGDLVIRGVKYRLVQRKGLPYGDYQLDYLRAIDALQGDDTPKPLINISGTCHGRLTANIPDTGYGG